MREEHVMREEEEVHGVRKTLIITAWLDIINELHERLQN